jgi:Universal stress protein family
MLPILAKKLGAELSALWVRGSLPHYPETIDEIDVEEESAPRPVVRLIVLGHHGHSGLWGKLLGGVADRVSHLARCDVLIVRKKERL